MITFPKYASDLTCIPVNKENLAAYEDIVVSSCALPDSYNLLWGVNFETGFFWEAAHFDTKGIYQYSSLNTPEAIDAIEKLDKPDVMGSLLTAKVPSKYRQTAYDIDWKGVVLACQNPGDRSVRSVGSISDWWDFYTGACEFYGSDLFVKLHPWNSGEIGEKICEIARQYNCQYGKTNHTVIKNCQFVLLYNSSFSVDCFLRDVPVAQFAEGYFHKTPALTFTNRTYPITIEKRMWGKKLVNFLAHKYCFNVTMDVEKWVRMMRHFSTSSELFPLTDEFSYASSLSC
jgi:hypothetical protein